MKQHYFNTAFALAILALGMKSILPTDTAVFREISAERINIMEPSGYPRLVLANTEHAPKPMKNGQPLPFDPGPRPGMIFFNDEGTENGGFIFRGQKTEDGIEHGLHLSFDRYNQDQVVALQHIEQGDFLIAGLNIVDRPQVDIGLYFELMQAAKAGSAQAKQQLAELDKDGDLYGQRRAFYGTYNKKAMLQLRDPAGKLRIEMAVTADGIPQLIFFDEQESEVLRLPDDAMVKS